LQGSTIYVTLEPCSHHGKTPPCAELFLNKGIKKVVVGLQDPNPLVAGRGIALLKQNGIHVEMSSDFSEKCRRLAEIFLWHIQNKMPFVALKIALSADDKIAGPSGKTIAVTGEEARLCARELRAGYDATMIGAETFLQDDPLLDFRQTKWQGKKSPKVVILDPHGRAQKFFPKSRMNTVVSSQNIFFVKSVNEETLKNLYQKGICSLYVEGGATTHRLFIDQKLFQKLYCFRSQQTIEQGLPWVGSFEKIEEVTSSHFDHRSQIGKDDLVVFYPD
ncbi:bifunctional diaminohydroxyphosphoribosylaminopyrimidine deaminase/5-amino-6-(5-phosphoribosylamino)uracil reductase RibD, partial [bacterium]|nr:bifunctional diaminohydroxyphosphoribosylaminopyrimidine deaminase/5-amino-6-(5-phosphoribosylamino)uracil reductase RibD [bacterium]